MKSYLESLERRVRILEALYIEAKRDQEILHDFLGDDYFNKYNLIKNKIKDPEYKDIYKVIKKDPDEVKNFIDSVQSERDVRNARKSEGSKLIYSDDLWKVYRITAYRAALIYGAGTRWCITGRYGGHEERGEEYFYDYINDFDLDGGYYFYIKNDNKTKFCLLKKQNGGIDSIWDAPDNKIEPEDILIEEPEFPTVPDVFTPSSNTATMFSKKKTNISTAFEAGQDPNERCDDKTKEYYGYTPLEWHMHNANWDAVDLVIRVGAEPTKNVEWQNFYKWNIPNYLPISFITKYIDKTEMLEYAMKYSSTPAVQNALKLGADPNRKFSDGLTPLQYEVSRGFEDARIGVVKALLKAGAVVDDASVDNAMQYCKPGLAKLLKETLM